LVVSYNWKFGIRDGVFYVLPHFDIRNRSQSKSYRLGNIAYSRKGQPHWFDNQALWGKVLEPRSIHNEFEGAPVQRVSSLSDAIDLEVTIKLQSGRAFWMRGQGPGQQGRGRFRRALFWMREKLEKFMVPME
jgi:hypothetical protein